MGIQATFKLQAALNAGAELTERTHVGCCHFPEVGDYGQCFYCGQPYMPAYTAYGLKIPGMHAAAYLNITGEKVSIDFNQWGDIRKSFQPWLEAHKIPYVEG